MLIVEDGSGLQDAESYVSVKDAVEYASSRGLTFPDDPPWNAEAALRRATTWVDAQYRARFAGRRKKGREQALEWPRTRAVDSGGFPIIDDQVPSEIIRATAEAAVRELSRPGSLSPDYVPSKKVIRQTIGPITTQYAEASGSNAMRPVATVVEDILSGILTKKPGTTSFSFTARA